MVKRILYYLVSAAYVFGSSYCMPAFFLIAFNYQKGIQNNEDGIMFIPVGFFLIILTILIDVLSVKKALKISWNNCYCKLIIIAVSIVIFTVSVVLTFSNWKMFLNALAIIKA